MTPDPMVTWLRSALDYVERVAREAADGETGEWHESGNERVVSDSGVPLVSAPYGYLSDALGGHIALHDPRAVLARVEAERFILGLHEGSHECSSWNEMHSEYDSCCWIVDGGCSTVAALAYGHRFDVAGFRAEWAPEGVGVGG